MPERKETPYEYQEEPEPRSPRELGGMHPDRTRLIMAQRQEKSSRATLVHSLLTLGRFEEALVHETDPEQQEHIKSLIAADQAPDDEECNCVHLVDQADYTRNRKAKPEYVPAKRYHRAFRYWSPTYGTMASIQKCALCGHANGVPDHIEVGAVTDPEAIEAAKQQLEEADAERNPEAGTPIKGAR